MDKELKNKNIKSFYDNNIKTRYENDYEFNRWFRSHRLRTDYFMNYVSIKKHIEDLRFCNCLELGPGPGTWTRVLYKQNPESNYDLVDISEAMKDQFELEMRDTDNVNYYVNDVMDYKTDNKYDFVFSSRAIEYFDNKSDFLDKICSFMDHNGTGIIITKNKNFGFRKNNDKRFQHKGQLTTDEFIELIKNAGFKNIEIYPVIIRVPIFDRINTILSEKIFNNCFDKPLKGFWMEKITESFLVKFKK